MAEEQEKREPPKRVTKIKVKKGVYYLAWEVFRASTKNWDQHTLSCKDQPRPELLERLQVMANHVTEICEFGEWETKKLIVSGVSLSYGDKENCYLVITAQKALEYSKAPLIINTPARPAMPESDADSQDFCWSDELAADIEALEQEAWKYIHGERAQMTLDFEGGKNEVQTVSSGQAGGFAEEVTVQQENIGA